MLKISTNGAAVVVRMGCNGCDNAIEVAASYDARINAVRKIEERAESSVRALAKAADWWSYRLNNHDLCPRCVMDKRGIEV